MKSLKKKKEKEDQNQELTGFPKGVELKLMK